MILPTKRLVGKRCLMGVGADILKILSEPKTISKIWDDLKNIRNNKPEVSVSFDWYILTLDFLYIVNAIDIDEGIVRKVRE